MLIDPGPLDQRPAQALPDYGLIYRGEILAADLTIAGSVRVTLRVKSDCPDTDFVAKLIELKPDGCAMLLMDGSSARCTANRRRGRCRSSRVRSTR